MAAVRPMMRTEDPRSLELLHLNSNVSNKSVTTSSDIQISVIAAANIALDRSDVEVSAASISLSAGGDDMRLGGPPVQTVPARPRLATSKMLLLKSYSVGVCLIKGRWI